MLSLFPRLRLPASTAATIAARLTLRTARLSVLTDLQLGVVVDPPASDRFRAYRRMICAAPGCKPVAFPRRD